MVSSLSSKKGILGASLSSSRQADGTTTLGQGRETPRKYIYRNLQNNVEKALVSQ